nr:hypothetical protein CFP56_66571 [Quercus suber]
MIADEDKEEERQAAEEVASILADIETEVGVEIAVVRAEIAIAEEGEAIDEGADGQTVLGELLQLTTYYLSIKEKVVVAQSKAESAEAESSPFRKDLMKAMDQAVKSKEKAYELKKTLKVEKKLA